MLSSRFTLLAALFALCVSSPLHASLRVQSASAAATLPAATGTAPLEGAALAEAVDKIVAERQQRPSFAALSIAVARQGEIVFEKAYGVADAEFDVPADTRTMFRIGSVTKQFSSAIAMRMIERKELALDDELSKYVPEFPLQGRTVTVRHLLNHTSGIPSYTDVGDEWRAKWPLELTHEELLALVAGKPFQFEPGASWHYNNSGYYLLGMVLEKVSGKPYAQLVIDELAKPLGLERTRYDSNVELIKNRAQGYTMRDGTLVNDQMIGMNQPGAAGGLLSTAGDLARWMVALRGGKVVSPQSFAAMTEGTKSGDGTGANYGYGLGLSELEGRKRIEHGGGIFGFNSMLAWYPQGDVVVAVISSSEPVSSARIADEIALAALGIERAQVLDLALPAELATKLVGEYRIEHLDLDVSVTAKDSKLFLQATGQDEFQALYQGGVSFRAVFDNSVKVEFAEDAKFFTLHQGGGLFHGVRKL
jgi:CubicO group peptidase (beta-lactamase class C family)